MIRKIVDVHFPCREPHGNNSLRMPCGDRSDTYFVDNFGNKILEWSPNFEFEYATLFEYAIGKNGKLLQISLNNHCYILTFKDGHLFDFNKVTVQVINVSDEIISLDLGNGQSFEVSLKESTNLLP